eukprot:CAMPEP_0182444246 /NCGR_PEP_ID=MMETSP1172-20130603/2762_1 /TAXON_ID=708627 /ORGANISM="Timspurckia oligopyrenoides, Strain CCMP3278" /LENGTH=152 /DNA_ID=CAMNT_0024639763 /DNA_START=207 /DNA_END=662 /DNA_ORIENTATION=+
MNMINQLPNVQISGEHDGQLVPMQEMYEDIERNNREVQESGVGRYIDPHEFLCWVQKWFFLHTGKTCESNIVHGFKEIRYRDPDKIRFVKKVFPCAKFVLNYREDPEGYSLFLKDIPIEDREEFARSFEDFHKEFPVDSFLLSLEQFSEQKW